MKYGLVVDLGATNLRVAIVNDKYEIVKKIKCSPYLLYFTPYLTITLICFSCNTENDLKKLLPLIEHQIIISKIIHFKNH